MNFYTKYFKYSKHLKTIFFLLLFSMFFSLYAQENNERAGPVWIIPIRGDIEPSMATFVRREARKAISEKAEFIIFEIDTFGGRVDSALQITSFIMSIRNAKTIAWIQNSEESMGVSWSAGALIALSCNEIYMANGTSIGAAAPVTIGTDGTSQSTGEKTVSAVRSQMAALAERNGHPKGIALAMVDYDVELWEVKIDGVIRAMTSDEIEVLGKNNVNTTIEKIREISPKGKLLSLTAGEAYHYGLTRGIIDDTNMLLSTIGARGIPVISSFSISDGVITFLTSTLVQTILIILALILLYIEISSPGFGIPGTIALISFAIVFGSSALLGQVGSFELILFLLGIILLAVEIFILPGFGVVGISGIIAIGFSLVFSMQDFIVPRFEWEWGLLGRNAAAVSLGMVTSVLGIVVLTLTGAKFRLFDRLTLKAKITGTAGGPDPDATSLSTLEEFGEEENYTHLFGKTGIASSTLRPSGKAEIEGHSYSVETEGLFIESGKAIKVIAIRGSRIIVRQA